MPDSFPSDRPSDRPSETEGARIALWLSLLATAVVAWEYLLEALSNPGVEWSPGGVTAHFGLDVLFLLPVVVLAAFLGGRIGRRMGFGAGSEDGSERLAWEGLLGTAGLAALAFVLLSLPVTGSRDLAHEWVGERYGLWLAEVETSVVTSDLTVQESTQLCSFGAVRNPGTAQGDFALALTDRARFASRDVLVQVAAFLPLFNFGLLALAGRRRPPRPAWVSLHGLRRAGRLASGVGRDTGRFVRRPVFLGAVALGCFALFCTHLSTGVFDRPLATPAVAQGEAPLYDACEDGGPVKEYDVSAIAAEITLNRWGDHVENGYMYALDANVPAIREFEAALREDRAAPAGEGVARVSFGLRKDPIQPLVIRANVGECLRIHFTNAIEEPRPASLHILGLPHEITSAGSFVGQNPNTFADEGETITYEISIPDDPDAERAYFFHDHGASRQRQNKGLFGAIVVEPKGATYLDVETGEPLDTVTGSNWEAIILDPALDARPDAKSFREFVIFYHEIGDEAFTDIRDKNSKKLPLVDDIAGVYRPAARALNYRSEPFRRRLEVEKTGKSLGYASYPFGDPATPIPRSYVGEGVKTRLLHGGSEVFHVHHLHGGGDRWRRNPNADPNNDFWKGLTKIPDPNLTSVHLDSQSIGPSTSYNLEHECGAGGCQQGVGDFLFHCHIGHHYISGMWSFWRVFGTVQTSDTNMNGFPLAVVPELFQADNPFTDEEAASNTPPAPGVSAGELVGLVVDDGRRIVADADVADPSSQIGLREWIRFQLPPPGEPLDKFDATVWNWTFDTSGPTLRVLGEPEVAEAFDGWTPRLAAGQRPEVLFNPKNGRYTWPLFRPKKSQRPPFTARHSGAPWLGEEMKEGRMDGLCARNGVHPAIDVGDAVDRFYPVSSITMPLQVSPDKQDPDGMIFVLNEEEEAIRDGRKLAEPLTVRSNVGDCVEVIFTNKIPDGPLNKNFSKTNIHSHFVQFDTQASDGVITGMSYEQSVRPYENESRWLTAPVPAGARTLPVNHTERLRPGIWVGIGLGEGVCGKNARGQPVPCTEIRQVADVSPGAIRLEEPLGQGHESGEAVGVEFVRYRWYSDVDFGTVFYHTHVEFRDWDHGLFGTHIVEPKGATYHDPFTGEEIRAGSLADIRVDPAAGGNPVAHAVDASFREFVLYLHSNSPVEGRFARGGGTINLRAEPFRLRDDGEPAYRFSSVRHGDPHTQTLRAYVGDPFVIRGMGLIERVGGVRFTGHRFHMERYTDKSDVRDATFLGISERFDVSLDGGAGGPGGFPGDYLYYSTLGREFESGAWGILRVHDTARPDLQPLPENVPAGGEGFPQLAHTGGTPPPAAGADRSCPAGVAERTYDVSISDTEIVYADDVPGDPTGVVYRLSGEGGEEARTPLVVRAAAGECLVLNLTNERDVRAGVHLGELLFDPQHSYGSAIGFNHDSTLAAGETRSFRYHADEELGLVIGLNLADLEAVDRGAYLGAVVEPAGSTWTRPGLEEGLPGGGTGIQADVTTAEGFEFREYVGLFHDQDKRLGQNAMPYPAKVNRQGGISYSRQPLELRDAKNRPAEVFSSEVWDDPRHVVTVEAGTPLVYRLGQPWGDQTHVPTLSGHRFYLEPAMDGSEQLQNDVLVPGLSYNWWIVGGAGGDHGDAGDYLFQDRRTPFLEHGFWNILRVVPEGSGRIGRDRVRVQLAFHDGLGLTVFGLARPRPAGDFADAVTLYGASDGDGGCVGTPLGTASVEEGTGRFVFTGTGFGGLAEVCVHSGGGGSDTAPVL